MSTPISTHTQEDVSDRDKFDTEVHDEEHLDIDVPEEVAEPTKIRFFQGPLIFRHAPDVDETLEKLENGGIVYATTHPVFFAWPLLGSILCFLAAVLIALLGDNFSIYPLSILALLLFVSYLVNFVMVKTHFIAATRDQVVIQQGIIRSRPIILSISELSEVNLEKPLRGLGWLHYATWQPVLPGEQIDKPVKHIMYMSQMQEIINRLKNRVRDQQLKHDEDDLDEQILQNKYLSELVELSGQTVSLLQEVATLLKEVRDGLGQQKVRVAPITDSLPIISPSSDVDDDNSQSEDHSE
jgi:hypothetical protein